MNKENCALKLVDEIILYYDARSKKHQTQNMSLEAILILYTESFTNQFKFTKDKQKEDGWKWTPKSVNFHSTVQDRQWFESSSKHEYTLHIQDNFTRVPLHNPLQYRNFVPRITTKTSKEKWDQLDATINDFIGKQ